MLQSGWLPARDPEPAKVIEEHAALAAADYSAFFEERALSVPIKCAVITHRGELTPDNGYLEQYL